MLKKWNCDIALTDISDDDTILHELLHSCSVSYFDPNTFYLNEKIEEATVDYLSSLICREYGVPYHIGYPDEVNVLKELWKPLGYEDDMKFAKEVFNVSLPDRYSWLEEKTIQALKASNASDTDYRDVIKFVRQLKGGYPRE